MSLPESAPNLDAAAPSAPATPPSAPVPAETDRALLERALKGDTSAYATFFERHAPRVLRMAYLVLHHDGDADDAVQETFTLGLSRLSTYRGEAEPVAWLSAIALNVCRHTLRRGRRDPKVKNTPVLDFGRRIDGGRPRGVLTSVVRHERNTRMTVALGFLTEAQREVFVLHYINGLPYETIAELLGIRSGAARALSHRAKAILRAKLSPDEVLSRT